MMIELLFIAAAIAGSTPPVSQAQREVSALPAPATSRLRTSPEQVYFVTANAKEQLQGSIVTLIVEEPAGQSSTPLYLDLIFKSSGATIQSQRLLAPALQAVDNPSLPPTRLHSVESAKHFRWPHAYRIMMAIPAKAAVDAIEARLTVQRDGNAVVLTTIVPVRAYEQKTPLIFPFKGEGVISQGGALESGHRNRSGLYAIDALALSSTYGPMRAAEADNNPASYAGWGRAIIAPAAGRIVVARNDRPDQPVAGTADPAYFLPAYPDGGDPGNHVVIDHGAGEFSMIAHMQKGSVRVKVGDLVVQGQLLGLLGNSGDTSGPHVHYQLQNGPDWERSDALPLRFSNVTAIVRGSYFEAK